MNNMQLALNTTFVGVSVVFLALIMLSLIIYLFPKLIAKKSNAAESDTSGTSNEASILEIDEEDEELYTPVENSSNDELIAVLTAAVLAGMRSRPEYKIKIKSFRRVSQTSPVWNLTGRHEYISGKL